MLLPLDVRATMLAASLDVIAAEIRAAGRSTAPSVMLESVLADAQASACALAAELSPSYALAQAVGDAPRRVAGRGMRDRQQRRLLPSPHALSRAAALMQRSAPTLKLRGCRSMTFYIDGR
jgi:hypothetical protein